MENHHFFSGKIHYKWQFSIAMLVHGRVSIGFSIFAFLLQMDGFTAMTKEFWIHIAHIAGPSGQEIHDEFGSSAFLGRAPCFIS